MLEVTYQCELRPSDETTAIEDDIAAIISATTDELIALGYGDTTIGGSLVTRRFDIDIVVDGAKYNDADGWVDVPRMLADVDSAIRSAFHTAGVSTPGWPVLPNALRFERREINVREADGDSVAA